MSNIQRTLEVSGNHVLDVGERILLADGRLVHFGPGPDFHLDMFILASLGLKGGLWADRDVGQDSFNVLDNDPVIVLESSTTFPQTSSRWGVNLLSISGPGKLTAGTGIGQDRDDCEGMRDSGVIFHDFEEAVRCAELLHRNTAYWRSQGVGSSAGLPPHAHIYCP